MTHGGSDPIEEVRRHDRLWQGRAELVHKSPRLESNLDGAMKLLAPLSIGARGVSILVWSRAARLQGELGGSTDGGHDLQYEQF